MKNQPDIKLEDLIQENAAVKPAEVPKSAPIMPKATKEFKTRKFETQHIEIVKS